MCRCLQCVATIPSFHVMYLKAMSRWCLQLLQYWLCFLIHLWFDAVWISLFAGNVSVTYLLIVLIWIFWTRMDFGLFFFFLLVAFECGLKRVTCPRQDGTLSPFAFRFFQFLGGPAFGVCVPGWGQGGQGGRPSPVCGGLCKSYSWAGRIENLWS